VALAWVTGQPAVTSTILGARTMEQLEDNLGSVDVTLTLDELTALEEASALHPTDYPYGDLAIDQRSRNLSGG
jgi:aryl-alcohol dehydrogenase-like predicted oxidoreductase